MEQKKREYTIDERKKIINYIIDNEGFYSLRGNAFWKKLEKEKIVQRTWQSMKEHFRMKIINNLRLYDISKENEGKIIAGYNNTKTVEKTDKKTTHIPKYNNLDFSDEEKDAHRKRCLSTSSDDSDILVIESAKSTSKKGFKKQVIGKKITKKIISDTEESVSQKKKSNTKEPDKSDEIICEKNTKETNNEEENDTAEIHLASPLTPDLNSDNFPSCNVSSTNLDETCVEFSITEDKKFMQALIKYDSNLQSCATIVTFIKQYTDYYFINHEWLELYDRFIEILNNLQLYDFLTPQQVTRMQNLKEPLEKYRINGFQEPKTDVLSIKFEKEKFQFTLAPNPELIYLKKEPLNLASFLENSRNTKYDIIGKIHKGEISQESVSDIISILTEFKDKYNPEKCDNDSDQEVNIDVCPEIRIKEENLSVNIENNENDLNDVIVKQEQSDMVEVDNQSNISDFIPIQPEISINLSEFENNNVQSSQYLEPLTTEELNVTNIVEKIIDEDLNESDFLTCQSTI